uniref:Uncharacterized protein n=2 Tax=uncultured Desulfobacterium sp. TaxID=201089 RepID=E1YCS1_9BACT|nr:unknown protein [uncultured Desulfobacterium sp.]
MWVPENLKNLEKPEILSLYSLVKTVLESKKAIISIKHLSINVKIKEDIGSSLKSMGNPIQDMIDISHQEIEEVETNYYERYGTISVGIGFDITMAC